MCVFVFLKKNGNTLQLRKKETTTDREAPIIYYSYVLSLNYCIKMIFFLENPLHKRDTLAQYSKKVFIKKLMKN